MSKMTLNHRLLVLGMLRMQDMHGYQIAEVIESHFDDAVHIKKPTLYDTLKRLAEQGLVDSREERAGNRPPRTVYSMTDAGDKEFMRLLAVSMTEYDPLSSFGDIGLMFVDSLPEAETFSLLSTRRERLAETARAHDVGDSHAGSMRLASERMMLHLRTELAWLDDVLSRLTAGDADE